LAAGAQLSRREAAAESIDMSPHAEESQAARPPGLCARLVNALAERPVVFDALRWLIEFGFRGEKRVLRKEGAAEARQVLDLGCGTGVMAGVFEPSQYVGIDPNPRYVHRARERRPGHRFLVMDGRRLAFGAGCFDLVLISGVLHHLDADEARAVLSEVSRVLDRETGKLLVWEDIPTPRRFNLVGKALMRLDAGDHIRSTEEYAALIEERFRITDRYFMSSGFWDYAAAVAVPAA